MNKSEIERRVHDVGCILHLEEIFKSKPKKLSAGDQQRVALARAMVRQPKVYLMDEPLSSLDAKLRVDMRVELRRLQIENGVTTIYVTHDQIEAMAMADRIAIMNKGFLLQVGTPDEVYAYPANLFVANFIGSPSMNFIRCTYKADTQSLMIRVNGDSVEYRLPKTGLKQNIAQLNEGAELVLGVRPEDVTISTEPVDSGLECQMILTEALGSENIHHLQHHALLLKSRTGLSDVFAEGQTVWVTFVPEGVRFFDHKTEQAI
jgi:multiple sugar transport system ATP-binding protein